jgi:hypothetical protein
MEQESLGKLLNGVLLKKYSCINTIKVSYDSLHNNLYYVIVYVIPVNNQKGFSDCNRDYPEIKQDIIDLSDSMGIHISTISQATFS